jgi:glutathione synthase/RimK-type ligase-like ATP-grasp enzyme
MGRGLVSPLRVVVRVVANTSSDRASRPILVLTNPGDFHALVVGEALRRKGACVLEWYTSDFPSVQRASWSMPDAGWEVSGPEFEIKGLEPTTVWVRRPSPPVIPSHVDPADKPFALRESRHFLNSLFQSAGREAFWVNPLLGAGRAELKTEQLKAATKAGLQIPVTLCSNDPARIRSFIRNSRFPVIYKAFYPVSWETANGVATLFSAIVTEENLPDDAILQAVPGIYQQLISKAFELRITAIGKRLFTAKLDSQSVSSGRLDWRAAKEPIQLEPFKIENTIARACRAVMSSLGIVFGCFDFIVTPAGEFIFLEVNEMGSFLWVEEQNPEFMLLDAFCEFLIQANPSFLQSASSSAVRFLDVQSAAVHRMEVEAPQLHVSKPFETLIDNP